MNPLEFNTVTNPGGSITTSTPGGQMGPSIGGGVGSDVPMYGGLMSYLVGQKQKADEYSIKRKMELDAQANEDRRYDIVDRNERKMRANLPTLGASGRPDIPMTRTVLDPRLGRMTRRGESYGAGGQLTHSAPSYISERMLPNGRWEFDGIDGSRA
mgnify:CR=1 FL=1